MMNEPHDAPPEMPELETDKPPGRNYRLTIAYDGTAYAGWQLQADGRGIQDVLETLLGKLAGERVVLHCSGRTDASVHALGQVATFRTHAVVDPYRWLHALHGNLPYDIAVLEIVEVPYDFHPRTAAKLKRYRYLISDSRVPEPFARNGLWWSFRKLDVAAMRAAAESLIGTHDFATFQSSGSKRKSTTRTVSELRVWRPFVDKHEGRDGAGELPTSGELAWRLPTILSPAGLIAIEIVADGFLYNMVRTIAGTLAHVGSGHKPIEHVAAALAAKDRRVAGQTAPARGLYLVDVQY